MKNFGAGNVICKSDRRRTRTRTNGCAYRRPKKRC